MKKIVGIIVAILILAVGGYYIYQQKQNNTEDIIDKKEVIKIGAIIPLTGRFAEMSLPIKDAMDMAVNDINQNGGVNGKTIQIVYGDSKGNATTGVNEVLKMINSDDIKIITTFLTGVSEAVKPITEKNNILLLAQTVSPTILKDSKKVIRFHYNFIEEGKAISNFILSHNINKNIITYIQSNDPSGSYRMEKVIRPTLNNNNIKLNQIKYDFRSSDFKKIVISAMKDNPKFICIDGYGTNIAKILREINQYDLTNKILLGNIGFIELPANTPAEIYHNFIFTVPPFLVDNNEKIVSFKKKYRDFTNKESIGYSAYYAYEMMNLLGQSLNMTDNINEVKSFFIGKHNGVIGNYEILKNGDLVSDIEYGKFANRDIVRYSD